MDNYLIAAFLGLVEGLTEFLPVSSTGHLILLVDLLGLKAPPGRTFEVMIQLGAILAICILYFRRLWETLIGLPRQAKAQRFALLLLVGFLPAMVLGALFHKTIKEVLFSPVVVGVSLILGGIVILIVELMRPVPRYHTVDDVPLTTGLGIGFAQALAMIPGTSRSGATIIGGLLLGLERRAAAELSFFLAIPTMTAAFVYDAYKTWDLLSFDDLGIIAIGFITAFLAALLVVRPFLMIVSRIGFAPFAYYRVALGVLVLTLLWL
ncbi:MAG: undecaprenyl-diphosphate phosphatase [Hyphomicrobiaceae bacterium]